MTSKPLSPHLQVYRPQITSVLSIMHRATGIFLSLGAFVLAYWLVALASGETRFQTVTEWFTWWPIQLLLIGWVFAFYYHLCNGIRHLFWDIGKGFELATVSVTGFAVLGAALVLSIATLIAAFL
ncbi:MAG: succinate dehydrogenase, cytochrome b556 subunit [Gammaproteobacteria bacterium]